VALKLHALDVRGLLRSQWRLRSSLIGILEMGVVNLKPAEYEQRWQKNLIVCSIQSSTSHERSCNLNFLTIPNTLPGFIVITGLLERLRDPP
jgi:hypothetical protein